MKKAFTMLELVFVIVVIGILAAAIIPSTRTNPAQEAAIQLLSDIRYTQHLAMIDDKYGQNTPGNVDWFQKRWQIVFAGDTYSIESNGIPAADPSNGNPLQPDLNAKYGVTISLIDGCNTETIISFDHLGRPMLGTLNTGAAYTNGQLLTVNNCNIQLQNGTEIATINIARETGYASIAF